MWGGGRPQTYNRGRLQIMDDDIASVGVDAHGAAILATMRMAVDKHAHGVHVMPVTFMRHHQQHTARQAHSRDDTDHGWYDRVKGWTKHQRQSIQIR